MSAKLKQQEFTFDAATHELWRAAENGDAGELASMRGVDVNARNEHGMTALMRAARYGHAAAVRTLLERGADPNVARNDRFTALALAAFFGHTETVRILIEHGAKTEIVTRSGTSPRMWATARTFTDAARCFEKPAPAPVRRIPAPAPVRPVVQTLKEPPEIWDLVHEVPKGFDARSVFVSRIKSTRRPVAIGVFAGLLFAICCVVAAFFFRSSQASDVSLDALPPVQTPAEVRVEPPVPVESPVIETPANADIPLSAHVVRKTPVTRQLRLRPIVEDNVVQQAPSREEPQVAIPEIEKPKPRASVTQSAPNAPLSPHLITPAKSAAPKAKVIQWP